MPQESATHLRPNSRTVKKDSKIPGLQLRTGARASVWYVYFRTRAGRERRLKLGDQRVLPLETARKQAMQILAAVARGEDPADRPTSTDRSIDELLEWYLERYAKTRQKPTTLEGNRRQWIKHVTPALKGRTVQTATTQDFLNLHHKMRNTPYAANRLMEVLHCAFGLAVKWNWIEKNPVVVDAYPEHQRKRKPDPDEAVRLFSALDDMREQHPHFVALVELLALTGARLREIMEAQWDWVKPDGLHLPDSKTGAKIIPLNQHARDVLAGIPRVQDNPWIIVGRFGRGHITRPKSQWSQLLNNAKITSLRLHDLRRYFAAAGIAAGLTLEQVGQLLGHTQAQTTRRYAWLLTGAATAASEIVANHIRRPTIEKT